MRHNRLRACNTRAICGVCAAAVSVIVLGVTVYATAGERGFSHGALVGGLIEVMLLTLMSASLSLELRCGGLDFSLGAVAVLSPCLSAYIFSESTPLFAVISVFFGALLGLVSAGVRIISGLSCALCSLCMCLIYEGLSYIAMSGNSTLGAVALSDSGELLSLFVLVAVCTSALYLFVEMTPWGAEYRAMSKNREIAELCGVDIRRCEVLTHIISGALMGGAGALLCVREGGFIRAGLSFASVRILFFGLLPLFWGRLYSHLTGEAVGDMLGVICTAVLYSALRVISDAYERISAENLTALVGGVLLLIFLAFLSNKKSFFVRIRTKDRLAKKI